MGKLFGGKYGGFLAMVLSILGVVLFVTLFSNILTGFVSLYSVTNAGSYIAYTTIVTISPTILLLAGIFGAGFTYYKGYKQAGAAGINALLMTVLGCLEIILFVTLFTTIMSAMETLRTNANIATFTAFSTVVTITPAVLLLGGLFAGGATVVGGVRKMRQGKNRKMLG